MLLGLGKKGPAPVAHSLEDPTLALFWSLLPARQEIHRPGRFVHSEPCPPLRPYSRHPDPGIPAKAQLPGLAWASSLDQSFWGWTVPLVWPYRCKPWPEADGDVARAWTYGLGSSLRVLSLHNAGLAWLWERRTLVWVRTALCEPPHSGVELWGARIFKIQTDFLGRYKHICQSRKV